MLFQMPNQQCQSTQGKKKEIENLKKLQQFTPET